MTRMRYGVVNSVCVVAVVIAAVSVTIAQSTGSKLRFIAGWAKMPVGEWEIARVAVAANGERLFAFKRSDPPIVEFDPRTGKVLAEWGEGLVTAPHGMYVDREGNLWVTDAGRHGGPSTEGTGLMPAIASAQKAGKGFQVLKFSPGRKLVLALGTAGVQGHGTSTFGAPTDVVVGDNGDIFVADGHELVETEYPRIVKFTKSGQFIKEWGRKGTGPGEFSVPHALAIDSRGRLLVSDRGNQRIQVFSQDGQFLEQWPTPGRGAGLAIGPGDTMYLTIGHNLLIGDARNGKLHETIDDVWAEGVTADARGNVWVGEVYRRAVKKFVAVGTPPVARP